MQSFRCFTHEMINKLHKIIQTDKSNPKGKICADDNNLTPFIHERKHDPKA